MKKILSPHIIIWIWLLVPLTVIGFWPSYFSTPVNSPAIFHIHASFMILWIAMAILQPLLIYKKQTKLHKAIGKASYIIMPLVILAAWLMTRHSYFNVISSEMAALPEPKPTVVPDAIKYKAGTYMRIGLLYGLSLAFFYVLAIVYRKRMAWHASFMFAAVLTLLGPTVDRILYTFIYSKHKLPVDGFIVTFILIDIILLCLLVYQYRKVVNWKATLFALLFYVSWQVGFYVLPDIKMWKIVIDPFG